MQNYKKYTFSYAQLYDDIDLLINRINVDALTLSTLPVAMLLKEVPNNENNAQIELSFTLTLLCTFDFKSVNHCTAEIDLNKSTYKNNWIFHIAYGTLINVFCDVASSIVVQYILLSMFGNFNYLYKR